MQDHLDFIEQLAQPARLGRFGQLPADATAGNCGERQDHEVAEIGVAGELQIPAIGSGDVESAEIRKLAIEFVDDRLRLGERDAKAAAVGENQTFLVQP
ncbi:MAG: hypothetical protein IPK02_16435 [Candidatus Accumulibacter sp.]|uniref:Uncharacterized protein n=1 Tax=Candidatus Accumulibacter affinis TaxID=2954384 RepID=A0A935TDG6_9PROT|nr:hypothetical protein [Candidatus Accumulibacter affinis]